MEKQGGCSIKYKKMATKFDFSAFNGEIFNSKKSLTATKHRTAHGEICRYIQVRNKETFLVIQLVWHILKQLFTSVSVNSGGYLPRRFAAR